MQKYTLNTFLKNMKPPFDMKTIILSAISNLAKYMFVIYYFFSALVQDQNMITKNYYYSHLFEHLCAVCYMKTFVIFIVSLYFDSDFM